MATLDPRFALRYNHPHIMTHIVDNSISKKTETVAEASDPSLFGTLVVTGMPMGLDRQIYTQTNESVLKATTGLGVTTDSDRNIYGQSVDYALDVVRQNAPVRLLRVTPEDATYAFNAVFVEWQEEENSFNVRFNELNKTDLEELGFEFNKFTSQKNLNDQLVKFYAKKTYEEGDWFKRIFVTNIAQGRGSAYNKYITAINSISQGKNPADAIYDFHVINSKTNGIVETVGSASLVDVDNQRLAKHKTLNKQVAERTLGASVMIPFVNESAVEEVYKAYRAFLEKRYQDERTLEVKTALEMLSVNNFDILGGKAIYKSSTEELPMYSIKSVSSEVPKLVASQLLDVPATSVPETVIENTLKKVTYGVYRPTDKCYLGKIYLSENKTSGIKLKLVAQINQNLGSVTPITISKVYPLNTTGTTTTVNHDGAPVSISCVYTSSTAALTNKNLKVGDVVAYNDANAITLQMVTGVVNGVVTVKAYPDNLIYEALVFDRTSAYQNEYFARSATYGTESTPGAGADKGFKFVGACIIGNTSETTGLGAKIANGKAYVVTAVGASYAANDLAVDEITRYSGDTTAITYGECPTDVPITADVNNTQYDVRRFPLSELKARVTGATVTEGTITDGSKLRFVVDDIIEDAQLYLLTGSGSTASSYAIATKDSTDAIPVYIKESSNIYYLTNLTGNINAEGKFYIGTDESTTYDISEGVSPCTIQNKTTSANDAYTFTDASTTEQLPSVTFSLEDGAQVYEKLEADDGYYHAKTGVYLVVMVDEGGTTYVIDETECTPSDTTTPVTTIENSLIASKAVFTAHTNGDVTTLTVDKGTEEDMYETIPPEKFIDTELGTEVALLGESPSSAVSPVKITIGEYQCEFTPDTTRSAGVPNDITRFNIKGTKGSLYKSTKYGAIPYDYYTDTYGIKLDSENGGVKMIADSGYTGFFDDYANGTIDTVAYKWKYSALLVKAFRGGFDSRIRSTHQVQAAYLFDANFNTTYNIQLDDDSSYTIKEIIQASSIFTADEKEEVLNNPELLEAIIDVPEDIDVKQAMCDLAIERNFDGVPEDKRPVGNGSGFQVYFDVGTGDYEENMRVYESMAERFDNENFVCDIGWWEEGGFKYTYPKRIIESLYSFCVSSGNINKPFVLAPTNISPDRYTSYSPAIEGNEWTLKEEIYNKGANVWCIDSNNNLQRQFQHTFSSVDESSSMIQESNQRTLNVFVRTIKEVMQKYIFQYDEDGIWRSAIDECNTHFVGWKGTIVKDYSIERQVFELPNGTEQPVLWVTISFRGLILSIPVIVNIEK